MKVLFRWIKDKISGIWTKAVVPHARICMISGAVVAVAGASAITAVEYINYNNKTQIQAKETEAEMQEETQTHNNVEQTKPVVMETETETQEQTPAETESTTQEEISELVMAAVTDENTSSREIYEIIDKAASDSDIVIPVKDVEDIDIVEDNSSEPSKDETEVEEPPADNTPKSDEIYEVSQFVEGIDVSKWQGDIDWTAVASDGITFAMIKCGGGDDEDGVYEDRYFRRNIEGALANGIQVGVYFFSGATNSKEAYDEASYCINLIKDYKITYPVAFDWELGYGDYNEVTEACETFCNVVKSYGYTPMVYSSRNGWYNSFDGERLASKYKVWMAAYFGKFYYDSVRWKYGDDLPNFRYNFDMWQYSSRCYVSGIDGFVDVNIAFFGYANYHVDTKDAVITVTNTDIKRTYNPDAGELTEELNLLDGVKGTNSIGYDTEVEYSIYDDEGNEYSEADAISRAGAYTVEYRFKDPKSGWIKNTARLEIIVMSGEKESTQQETKEEV